MIHNSMTTMNMRRHMIGLLSCCWLLCFAQVAHAEAITKITYGFGPGTGDTVIRSLAADAEQQGKHRFIVNNKPGAGGVVAIRDYFKEPASEHNLLGITTGQAVIEAALNPENDFTPRMKVIGPVITAPLVLAVGAHSEIRSMADLFDRSKPRRIINIGTGGLFHEGLVHMIARRSHHDIQAVRFKGGADSFIALMGGHIDADVNTYGFFLPHLPKVKMLAATQQQDLPHAPSMLEWVPEARMMIFFAIAVNKEATPTQSTELLQKGFAHNKRQQFWESQGYVIDPNRDANFVERVIIPELQRWQKILPQTKKD